MGVSLIPPQPKSGTFWIACYECFTSREEIGFSNEYKDEKPKCNKCGKEASIIEFRPLDPDADVDAT